MEIIMKGTFIGFTGFSLIVLGYLIVASNVGNSAVLTRCENPGYCFITWQQKNEWAASQGCQFDQAASSHDTLPPLAKDCSKKNRVDQAFLRREEGTLETKGYVPKYKIDVTDSMGIKHKAGEVIGVSGVTISTGIDLGQQSESGTRKILNNYISQFGNPDKVDVDALIGKLRPYFTKKKGDAVTALAAQPLAIIGSEADLLERAFGLNIQSGVSTQFDNRNYLGMAFQRLPLEAQTVIVDFAYQYGPSDTDDSIRQKFWSFVYSGDWQGLSQWLLSHPDIYGPRRDREGRLLRAALDNGTLPSSGNPCENVQDISQGEPLPEFVPPIIPPGREVPFPDA